MVEMSCMTPKKMQQIPKKKVYDTDEFIDLGGSNFDRPPFIISKLDSWVGQVTWDSTIAKCSKKYVKLGRIKLLDSSHPQMYLSHA